MKCVYYPKVFVTSDDTELLISLTLTITIILWSLEDRSQVALFFLIYMYFTKHFRYIYYLLIYFSTLQNNLSTATQLLTLWSRQNVQLCLCAVVYVDPFRKVTFIQTLYKIIPFLFFNSVFLQNNYLHKNTNIA